MNDQDAIIAEARDRLARGQEKSKSDDDPLWAEFHTIYDAQDLLVKKGYEEGETAIQEQFGALIPVNSVLQDRLDTVLKDLHEPSVEKRIEASKLILREVSNVFGIENMLWMRHPASVEAILPALRDGDDRVVKNVLYAIGHLHNRFADPRIVAAVKPFLAAEKPKLIDATISATFGIQTPEKWHFVFDQLATCKNQKRLSLLMCNANSAPDDVKPRFIELLVQYWSERKMNAQTKVQIVDSIARLITDSNVDQLRDMLRPRKMSPLRTALIKEIEFSGLDGRYAQELSNTAK